MPNIKKIEKRFNEEIQTLANQAITEKEMQLYDHLYEYLREKHQLHDPADIMLLDSVIFDFIRIKRTQRFLLETGDFVTEEIRGKEKKRVNEAGYYLNSLQAQVRSNMRELLLTKKERTKANINKIGNKGDFSAFLTAPVDAVIVEEKPKK